MVRLVCAWVLVNGLLLAPSWIVAAVYDGPFPWLSVEAAIFVGLAALLPFRRGSRTLTWAASALLVVLAAALFANLVFEQSLGRSLDLSLDLYLLDAVYRLAVGNSGLARTLVGIAGIVLGAAALTALTAWLLTPSAGADGRSRSRISRAGVALAVAAPLLGLVGLAVPVVRERFVAPAAGFVRDQALQVRETRRERAAFAAELADGPTRFADLPNVLASLDGRRVVLAYIESYGMAALEDPEIGAVVRPVLQTAHERLDSAGVQLVSGRFTSPTLGGQSWYAHGTMLSGLWLDNQARYEMLLASERETLIDDFRRAGYRTATVMPAITTGWPEAVRIGYDDVHTSRNIPYAGPPLYWVTMPDQFTWSFLAGLLRETSGPLFVETGMVSSHAPWIPVLPILDWDEIGDGSVFEPYRLADHPPEEIWWDVEVLRSSYASSVAYSLETMAQFAERFLDDRTLLVVAGDHQAAPWVTGAEGADVPVHVMARSSDLIDPFVAWGFAPGPLPEPGRPTHRMDTFREWFVRAFTPLGGEATSPPS